MNREDWLDALKDAVAPRFAALGSPLPPKIRMAIGYPSTGAKGRRVGECWSPGASADETFEIFLRPDEDRPVELANTVIHELIHAAVGLDCGHGRKFAVVARQFGFEPPMKYTLTTPAFTQFIIPILGKLGPLPHARLSAGASSGPTKQSSRMLKCECGTCGYTVRVARKWLEATGAPICPVPAHGQMTAPSLSPDDEEPE